MSLRKAVVATLIAAGLFGAGILVGQNRFNKPKSIIHVVTIKWADNVTDAQKQSVAGAVDAMAGKIPGITNVWTTPLKVQGEGYTGAFVIEFKDKAAFDAYADHPAHREFEKVYLPLRGRSTTHDITN